MNPVPIGLFTGNRVIKDEENIKIKLVIDMTIQYLVIRSSSRFVILEHHQ